MSRKYWTIEKIFSRLLTHKTQNTFWDNISELRRRPHKEVYSRAFQFAKSDSEKEKINEILGFQAFVGAVTNKPKSL
jgi:hypothetical protein